MTQKHQIYAQVLEVDKENSIKQMRQKYFLSFIYSGKWSNIAYPILWVAKVCESLGFAVNLKVKLESIRAEVFSVYQMSVCDLFYSKNRDLSKSDHVCVSESRTKEITEDLGNRVNVAHQARKGYKTISKDFGLHKSTVKTGNSRLLLPSREVVVQQRSLQSRTCNSLRGCKSSQGNF